MDSDPFECYICRTPVHKPRLCPVCSKLACFTCLQKWTQNRPECPHCRTTLLLNAFPDCQRFVDSFKDVLQGRYICTPHRERCGQHETSMEYYCEDCHKVVCSDCGLLGTHREHHIEHLNVVYSRTRVQVFRELAHFDQKIQAYRSNGKQIKMEIERLATDLWVKKNYLQKYFAQISARLNQEYRLRKQKLEISLEENNQIIDFLQNFRGEVRNELLGKPEKELIERSQQFRTHIKKLASKQIPILKEDLEISVIHQIVPRYKQFYFRIPKQQSKEVIYSDYQKWNGKQWRLKVYPKGNGGAKGTHLSVFLQLSRGPPSINRFEYKICLINKERRKSIARQFCSQFSIGQCLGYNLFIPVSELSKGFMEQGQLLFDVGIRFPHYFDESRDQANYIQYLEDKLNFIYRDEQKITESDPVKRLKVIKRLAKRKQSLTFSQQKVINYDQVCQQEQKIRMGKNQQQFTE